jgi:lipopolysaccharide transport system permease protein
VEAIPPSVRSLVYLNPLTSIVLDFRAVLLRRSLPDWRRLAFWVLATGGTMVLGYAWFMKTKKAFADVM